jgi:DNA-binding response OmpR family regulator
MRGCHVLIIDDDPDICELLRIVFEGAGATVQSILSARDIAKRKSLEEPDLIVMDILMPGVNGWELIRYLSERIATPILVLTGLADPDSVARGLDCGAIDYVTKPFSPAVLLARAKAAVRRVSPPPSISTEHLAVSRSDEATGPQPRMV